MFADTHVCLVSEQPTPNITPVLDPAVAPRRVILIVSPDMEQRAKWLEAVLKPRSILVERWTIDDPWDVEHIEARVLELLDREQPGRLALNATGGTKPMSIAAYREFRDANAPIFYVHPYEDRVIWLHPKGRESVALADRIKLEPFLMAHGATVGEGIDRSQPDRALLDIAGDLVRDVATLGEALKVLNRLAGQAERNGLCSQDRLPEGRRDAWSLAERFAVADLLTIDHGRLRFPCEEARFFVNGGWLELYAFQSVQRLHAKTRPVQDLGRAIRVERLIRSKPVRNELDVAVLSDNRLYLIECKTRSWGLGQVPDPGADALYKLDSLADLLGGLQARTMLLSFQDLPDRDRRRAGELRIAVCAGAELLRLQEILSRWLPIAA
ncbi:MAG: DUF1887 family protein [Gammaproteobacteria bacterium]|nr:DUF1887 family protein [Gammaproteobacteria bacterium]